MGAIQSTEKTKERSFAEEIQKYSYELQEDELGFFKGCRNAFLLTLPFWITISVIWLW